MTGADRVWMGKLPPQWNEAARSITFCVTEDCNLACRYCYMVGKNKHKVLSFEVARRAVDYILSNSRDFREDAVVWEFVGGEPFLEIDLIDRICDYIKQQMFLRDHRWFGAYRFNFSTNGVLYATPRVQRFIAKNARHVSVGISIDGNKVKHDLQRVRPDGSGSFDDVVRNVPLWLSQFPNAATKATFTHEDLPHLKDSILFLWSIGIKSIAANVVFEDVWHDGDDQLFEAQLRALADHVIAHGLYRDHSVRFFDPSVGLPLNRENLTRNFCGAGRSMLAIDCDGSFYPCIRFYGLSLRNRRPLAVGNVEEGIDRDRLRPFELLTLENQSPEACLRCEVGQGCAWCSGCNYDCADTDTIFQRATYNCKMHKANARANDYFWRRLREATGLGAVEREAPRAGGASERDVRYMQIILRDDLTPHCSYRTGQGAVRAMSDEMVFEALQFCARDGFVPVFLGERAGLPTDEVCTIVSARSATLSPHSVPVFDNTADHATGPGDNCILLVRPERLGELALFAEQLSASKLRVNVVLEELGAWTDEHLSTYEAQLSRIAALARTQIAAGRDLEINVLTDRWHVEKMSNCDSGETSFCLAPNGRFYLCPAFYFADPDDHVGTLSTGIHVGNPRLLTPEGSPLCRSCDAYTCRRCKFLNRSTTGEIGVPPEIQCRVAGLERDMSEKLARMLEGDGVRRGRSLPWETAGRASGRGIGSSEGA